MVVILGLGGLIGSILAIVAGGLVLLFPNMLRVVFGLYLIIVGVLGVVGSVL